MTLAPAIHPDIRGVEGKRHPVGPTCCVPGCITPSHDPHHMWPKSYLQGQPTEWVRLPSGRVVSNVVGICLRHHKEVTGIVGGGHLAWITLELEDSFVWLTRPPGEQDGWINGGLLYPQPWSETEPEPVVRRLPTEHSHLTLVPGQTCVSCGYTRPVEREPGPKRPTKSYGILVPDDAEIGADVLDEWVEQFATILGFGPDVSKRLVRYHTIVAVLAWSMQHRQEFINDIAEVQAS